MKLEIGKYYVHEQGMAIRVIMHENTTRLGSIIIAETQDVEQVLAVINPDSVKANEWVEITKEDWKASFTCLDLSCEQHYPDDGRNIATC